MAIDARDDIGGQTAVPHTTDGQGTYRAYHDPGREGLAETITLLLAEIDGRDPAALVDDFGRHADPDALDALFGPRPDGTLRRDGRVTLEIAGYEVTVHADGDIVVEA